MLSSITLAYAIDAPVISIGLDHGFNSQKDVVDGDGLPGVGIVYDDSSNHDSNTISGTIVISPLEHKISNPNKFLIINSIAMIQYYQSIHFERYHFKLFNILNKESRQFCFKTSNYAWLK